MSRIMAGDTFDRWEAVDGIYHYTGYRAKTLCRCTCGTMRMVDVSSLKRGISRSCGCLLKEIAVTLNKTHGMTDSPTYNSWCAAKQRCYYPKSEKFPTYGGRGIKMCDRWKYSFENFLEDMGTKPEGKTLERNDVNGDYEPGNCRWATPDDQANNKRSTVHITVNGQSKTPSQWEKDFGLPQSTVSRRIREMGWSPIAAVTIPCDKSHVRDESGKFISKVNNLTA